jgi:preprotein translocase subunit SecA
MEDELMKQFGGDRIIEMMNKLGYKDDEVIEHSMVSSSIQRAQKKIDEQVQFPSNTRNSKDWFKINVMK